MLNSLSTFCTRGGIASVFDILNNGSLNCVLAKWYLPACVCVSCETRRDRSARHGTACSTYDDATFWLGVYGCRL